MRALPKILFALTAVTALSLAYPASVQAVPTTYQYTGNHFTEVFGPYTTSDFVTAMLTLAGPLAPNTQFTAITPIAFTISDGVQTITNLTQVDGSVFTVATGPAGQITGWSITVSVFTTDFSTIQTVGFPGDEADIANLLNNKGGSASNVGSPGTWTTVGSVADTGSTLSLMTLTLMALGVVARRFQRAAG